MTFATSNAITCDRNTQLQGYMEVIVMGIIIAFSQGHALPSWVALLNAVADATTNAIVTRLDAAMVATAMAWLQWQWNGQGKGVKGVFSEREPNINDKVNIMIAANFWLQQNLDLFVSLSLKIIVYLAVSRQKIQNWAFMMG
jgi:hypothetical protein